MRRHDEPSPRATVRPARGGSQPDSCRTTDRRRQRTFSRLSWLLPLVTLLAAAAIPAQAYLWEQTLIDQGPTPLGLKCTDVYLPKTIRIQWQPMGYLTVYEVYRGITYLGTTTNNYWVDSFDWVWNTSYLYKVRVLSGYSAPSMGLPPPPPDANPADIFTRYSWVPGNYAGINVTPVRVDAADNQAVDSRLDLRYGNPVLLDFQFSNRTYRGGLFAGYASDPSRVGRSFAKWTLPVLAVGTNVWASSIQAYHVQSFAPGNTVVGCQTVTSSWNGSTLKWSTAPPITPGAAPKEATISYAAGGGNQWVRWVLHENVCAALTGTGSLSVALAAKNETLTGWAYFAKKEYDITKAPCVIYAVEAPLEVAGVLVYPVSIQGGGTATGTMVLNGIAPTGGKVVSLASSHAAAQVPASVTVLAGQGTANFNITTSPVTQSTEVTITATLGASSGSTVILIEP